MHKSHESYCGRPRVISRQTYRRKLKFHSKCIGNLKFTGPHETWRMLEKIQVSSSSTDVGLIRYLCHNRVVLLLRKPRTRFNGHTSVPLLACATEHAMCFGLTCDNIIGCFQIGCDCGKHLDFGGNLCLHSCKCQETCTD